jgi:hypothetical protein
MNRLTAVLALALLVCLVTAPSFAAEKAAAPPGVTLSGEIVDLACYIGHGAKGAEHASCAAKCVEMGQPMGLAASDGKVYVLVADHADTSAFNKAKTMAGKKVEIKGDVAAKDGMSVLTVHDVKTI